MKGESTKPVCEDDIQKPPLGLRPRKIVKMLRIEEILEAMLRYSKKEKQIPKEWFDELKELAVSK